MKVAIVGATGMVGQVMLKVLAERSFPVTEIIPVASEKSIGKSIEYKGKKFSVVGMQTAVDMKADIAILRTMGATPKAIMSIFIVQGAYIGVLGTLIGTTIGVLLSLNVSEIIQAIEALMKTQFLNPDVYFISDLPSELRIDDVVVVTGSALAMSLLATLYPAWRASKVQPAEALRYE